MPPPTSAQGENPFLNNAWKPVLLLRLRNNNKIVSAILSSELREKNFSHDQKMRLGLENFVTNYTDASRPDNLSRFIRQYFVSNRNTIEKPKIFMIFKWIGVKTEWPK